MSEHASWNPDFGTANSGSWTYNEDQAQAVFVRLMEGHGGPERAINISRLAEELVMPGRTVRAIIGDLDGYLFLIGRAGQEGVFVCQYGDEGLEQTNKLRAQAEKMLERVSRRQEFSKTLPVCQMEFSYAQDPDQDPHPSQAHPPRTVDDQAGAVEGA